jgi:ankyrin repeat protein
MNLDKLLTEAAEYGHTEIVRILIDAGANVHGMDNYALRWAAENGHTETAAVIKRAMEVAV